MRPDRDDKTYWLMRAILTMDRDDPDGPDCRAEAEHVDRMLVCCRGDLEPYLYVRRLPGEPLLDYINRAPIEHMATLEAQFTLDHEANGRPGESFDAYLDRWLVEYEMENQT